MNIPGATQESKRFNDTGLRQKSKRFNDSDGVWSGIADEVTQCRGGVL